MQGLCLLHFMQHDPWPTYSFFDQRCLHFLWLSFVFSVIGIQSWEQIKLFFLNFKKKVFVILFGHLETIQNNRFNGSQRSNFVVHFFLTPNRKKNTSLIAKLKNRSIRSNRIGESIFFGFEKYFEKKVGRQNGKFERRFWFGKKAQFGSFDRIDRFDAGGPRGKSIEPNRRLDFFTLQV